MSKTTADTELLILGKHTDKELYEVVNKLNFRILDFLERFGDTPEKMQEIREQVERNIEAIQAVNEDLDANTEADKKQTERIEQLAKSIRDFVDIESEQLIHGTKTFNRILVAHPSSDRDAVNLGYMVAMIASKFALIVGSLSALKTRNKNLVVSAINELYVDLTEFKNSTSLENRLREIDQRLAPVWEQVRTNTSTSGAANEKSDTALAKLKNLEPRVEKNEADIEELQTMARSNVTWTPYRDGTERRTLEVENNDTLSGKKTDGSRVNIATITSRDRLELGAAEVEVNILGSAERPTYNRDKSLAFLSDLDVKADRVELQGKANKSEVYPKQEVYNKNEIDARLVDLDAGNFVTLQTKQTIPGDKTFSNVKLENMPTGLDHAAPAKYVIYYTNEFLKSKFGDPATLLTDHKLTSVGAINEIKTELTNQTAIAGVIIGNLDRLKTQAKDTLVNAINEIFTIVDEGQLSEEQVKGFIDEKLDPVIEDIGQKLSLKTENKQDLVSAINEIKDAADDILQNKIGELTGLETDNKESLVNAINELKNEIKATSAETIGDLSGLQTENKGSIADAINELKSGLNDAYTKEEVDNLISEATTPLSEDLAVVKDDYASKTKDNTLEGTNTFNKQLRVLEAPTEDENLIRKLELDAELEKITNSLTNSLNFKGALNTVAELRAIEERRSGDCYFIKENQVLYVYDGTKFINTGPIIDLTTLVDLSSSQNITGTKKFTKLKASEPTEEDDVIIKEYFDSRIDNLTTTEQETKEEFKSATTELRSLLTNMNYMGSKENLEEIQEIESPKTGEIWLSNENKKYYLYADEWMPFGIGFENILPDNLATIDTEQNITAVKTFESTPKITGAIENDEDAINLGKAKEAVAGKFKEIFPSPPTWTELEFDFLPYGNQGWYGGGFIADVGIQLGTITGGITEENKKNVYWALNYILPQNGGTLGLNGGGVSVLVTWDVAAELLPEIFTTVENTRSANGIVSEGNHFARDWWAAHPNYSDFSLDDLKEYCKSKGLTDYLIITGTKNNNYQNFSNGYSQYWQYSVFLRIYNHSAGSYGYGANSTYMKFKVYKVGNPGGVYDIHYSPVYAYNPSRYSNSSMTIQKLSYKMDNDEVVNVIEEAKSITAGYKFFRQLGTDEGVFRPPLLKKANDEYDNFVLLYKNQTVVDSKTFDIIDDNTFKIIDSSLENPDILTVTKDKISFSKELEVQSTGDFNSMSDGALMTKANVIESFNFLRVVSNDPPPMGSEHPIGTLWIKTSFEQDEENEQFLNQKPEIYIKVTSDIWYALHKEEIS